MRNFVLLIFAALIVAGGYGYKKNPKGCRQLGLDIVNDTTAIFAPADATKPVPEESSPAAEVSAAPVVSPPSAPAVATPPVAPPPVVSQLPPPDMTGNLLQNGDFSKGDSMWEGDGKPDPSVGKALVIPLNNYSWTKISQDFKGDKATDTILIRYKLSPDISVSAKPEDYANIGDHVRFEDYQGYGTIEFPVGCFLVWIGDLTNHASRYERFPIRPTNDVQTIDHTFPSGATLADKMITLAFPPGTGSVILLSISVKSN